MTAIPHGHIPRSAWIAGLLLILIAAVAFLQVFTRPPAPAPVPANPGTGLFPITPGAEDNSLSAPSQGSFSGEMNGSGTGAPANTIIPALTGTSGGTVNSTTPATRSREVPLIDASSLESKVHARVNSIRQEHHLALLGTDITLASLSRAHSRDMAANGYFGHLNLQEWDATARGAAAGYACHKTADPYFTHAIAENIFATYQYGPVILADGTTTGFAWSTEDEIADEAVDAWMRSPDHRDNILDPGMEREGIGIAISNDGLVFITQDLC
jgi:uncharacterized protein YkwD